MPIPDYQTIMLPALKFVAEKGSAKSNEVFAPMIKHFGLSDEEINALLPSGKQRIIDNRTQWALFYLYKAGLLNRPKRGLYEIADEGKVILKKGIDKINVDLLNNYESFREFRTLSKKDKGDDEQLKIQDGNENPEEAIEEKFKDYKSVIISELVSKVRTIEPTDFEMLILDLLKKMGYGVGEQSVLHLGKSGDGGVDGEINQDKLGLEKIYLQVKRYGEGNPVGRPAIQQFVGSLNERKSKKGIFITSSYFSKEAKDSIKNFDVVIRLIDGMELAELMYHYDIGVDLKQTYALKEVSEEYFESL
jgi:restriction system protein